MSADRLRVALVYGGKSAERDVSILSARTVAAAMDPRKYELVLVEIDEAGRWCLGSEKRLLAEPSGSAGLGAPAVAQPEAPLAGVRLELLPDGDDKALAVRGAGALLRGVDLIFPLLHGPCGEDGSIQGLARMADLPCAGADILASALCMDKDAAKRLMRDAGIPVAPFAVFRSLRSARTAWPELELAFGPDLFVKPADLGSSVGVSRARSEVEYEAAVLKAFAYGAKVLVERRVVGREIEVAVLGGEELRASAPGEIVPKGDFYDYESKYLDDDGAAVIAPARLTYLEAEACRKLALDACRTLGVRGMARVDMFLGPEGRPIANEVNTIPGFTARSMFPRLWAAGGLPLPSLVDELVELALEAHRRRGGLESAPPIPMGAAT